MFFITIFSQEEDGDRITSDSFSRSDSEGPIEFITPRAFADADEITQIIENMKKGDEHSFDAKGGQPIRIIRR